jgi:uncharacterized damage-inducible protein DinB
MTEEKPDKIILQSFANYNKRANAQMNEIIRTISEDELDKQFYGYYKSIHELCSHIFIADYGWINRFKLLCAVFSIRNYFLYY